LSELLNRFPVEQRVRSDAFYAQDQRTYGRMTLQGACASTMHGASFRSEHRRRQVSAGRDDIPGNEGVDSYMDLTPRGGVVYDVFGDGKTALKVSAGKYLEAAQNGGAFVSNRPTSRVAGTGIIPVSRTWTDSNLNFVADCDLLNPLAQNRVASGGDICGQLSDLAFGTSVFNTNTDPALLSAGTCDRPTGRSACRCSSRCCARVD